MCLQTLWKRQYLIYCCTSQSLILPGYCNLIWLRVPSSLMAKKGTFSWLPWVILQKFCRRMSNDATVPKISYFLVDMDHAGGRAHVSGHICCCPLEWFHNTLPDHWFQIVVFHPLYLMVPLLKRHFFLSWHCFATESVHTRGTKSQSHGQCIYKMSYIFIGLSGGRGLRQLSSGFPPSIWLGGSRGSKWLSCGFPPSPSWKGDLLVIHTGIPVNDWISQRDQQ